MSKEALLETAVFIKFILIIIGSVFAGYTVTDFDKAFLDKFNKPWVQFIIFLILSTSLFDFNIRKSQFNFVGIVLSALTATGIIQILKLRYGPKKEESF